ncbi:hypothetical protein J1N35_022898 [Gossypium stocksii]|uniref:Uncharacterized protein n=1 Tax=Gossypium stocksii TaxID=47602 RepID=A0A9D4A367_9ROSI|nr:hypothetical protein J1N35_022898 [Gossypium stocksii]
MERATVLIEPSKIIFGWDLSLRATVRHRNMVVSRWLREADSSQCKAEKLESNNQGMFFNEEKDIRSNLREDFWNQQLNPNIFPLGSNQQFSIDGSNKWRRWSKDDPINDGLVIRPMDLVLEAENDPIVMLEGKKRPRIVEGPLALLNSNVGETSLDLSASSGDQSSQAQ